MAGRTTGKFGDKAMAKIIDLKQAIKLADRNRKSGKSKIVMTNGCFDILHAGHISNLNECRDLGDILMVMVNSDAAVRQLKGFGRPLQTQDLRAFSLAALKCVDYVVIIDSEDVVEPLKSIRPNIWAKGADRNLNTLNQTERQIAEALNIEISFIPLVKGMSTSAIITQVSNILKVKGKF